MKWTELGIVLIGVTNPLWSATKQGGVQGNLKKDVARYLGQGSKIWRGTQKCTEFGPYQDIPFPSLGF